MTKREEEPMSTTVREEEKVLDFMDDIQAIIDETIKEKQLSTEDIEKALDYKRK